MAQGKPQRSDYETIPVVALYWICISMGDVLLNVKAFVGIIQHCCYLTIQLFNNTRCISSMEMRLTFYWYKSHQMSRQWLGTKQVTIRYLNSGCSTALAHTCVIVSCVPLPKSCEKYRFAVPSYIETGWSVERMISGWTYRDQLTHIYFNKPGHLWFRY